MSEIQRQRQRQKDNLLEQKAISQDQLEQSKFQAELKLFKKRPNLQKDTIDYLKIYHQIDITKYPPNIQKRFVEELQLVIDDLRDFKPSMIANLRAIREEMSFWIEDWKSDNYYRSLILWNTIKNKAILINEAVNNIAWPKIENPDEKKWVFNEADYNWLKRRFYQLDENLGWEIFSKLDLNNKFSLKRTFWELLIPEIDKNDPKYDVIITDLKKLQTSFPWERSDNLFKNLKNVWLVNWKKVDLMSYYIAYDNALNTFKQKDFIFKAWTKQIKQTKEWFWFDTIRYWKVWYDWLEKVYAEKLAKLENMWVADLVIMMRILFSIIPIAWDIAWWYDDIVQAQAWINYDWSIQWNWENVFWYLTWVLWLTLVWWTFAKVAKWPKYAEIISKIWEVIQKLSKNWWLEELAKNRQIMKMLENMKWVVSNIDEILKKLNWVNTLFIDIKWLDKLSESELNKKIFDIIKKAQENWKSIDKIDFSKNITPELRRKINHLIWINFPILNIFRLNPGQNVVDISFSWVKYLNDNVSKEFVDLFNDALKTRVTWNVNKNSLKIGHHRIVRSDYKHITFSIPPELEIEKTLFWEFSDRKSFILDIFKYLPKEQIIESLKLSKNEEILKYLNIWDTKKALEVAEKYLIKHYDFWIWKSKVSGKPWEHISMTDKMISFYKCENSSKMIGKTFEIKALEFDFETVKNFAQNALNIEKEIIKNFRWKKFEYTWVSYNITKILPNWEIILNETLLRLVRKWNNINNPILQEKVKNYIENLNNWFDFIRPAIDIKKIEQESNKLNDAIISMKVPVKYLEKTYKWTLTKDVLFNYSSWKEWEKVFVDIVDMWIMNLVDFRNIAKQIVEWKINDKNLIPLLESWKSVTIKFQEFCKEIQKKFWAKIALWWDEVYILLEWEKRSEDFGKILKWINDS